MKPVLILIPLTALVLIGCSKRPPQANQPAPQPEGVAAGDLPVQNPATAASVPPDPPPEVRARTVSRPSPAIQSRTDNIIRDSVVGEVNSSLTAQLQLFIAQKGRLPDNFAEFANSRLDSVPRPPEGKRWVIDAGALQVKAVKK